MIRPGGVVLDVACGRGRNARYLAARGFRVHAVDRDASALAALHDVPGISTALVDLEAGAVSFGHAVYDAVVVCNYLHRPLMPAIVDAVAPGGVLIYETFTRRQAARGRPTNPDFLLEDGELHALVAPLTVRHAREGEFDGKFIASVVAIR
jgi:SAM-dependent methyltransferase